MNNNYIVMAYKLYAEIDGERQLIEETHDEHPFNYISGMGMALQRFEEETASLQRGDTFDFVIAKDDAYGASLNSTSKSSCPTGNSTATSYMWMPSAPS